MLPSFVLPDFLPPQVLEDRTDLLPPQRVRLMGKADTGKVKVVYRDSHYQRKALARGLLINISIDRQ